MRDPQAPSHCHGRGKLGQPRLGALGWPLREIHSEDDGGDVFYYGFEPRGDVRWLHITAADDWVVVPHVAHRCAAHGVVLKISGAEQPLPMHILQTKHKSLMTDMDLHRLQKHLGLGASRIAEAAHRIAH